ncbi:MAG: prepilin-type N-terminal cleavage/methylation domain-containing protein [Clostridiales bacterium]|nr:prepilin-type N-terminal cleavage/methylation domain-containing protein [Clostridiales bacterium]
MKKNQGFILVELIIVIAIISILSLGTALSVGLLGYGNAKSATGRIATMLDKVRVENMTKKEQYYLVIYKENKDYYLSVQTLKDGIKTKTKEEKLKLKKGKISFLDTRGNLYYVSSDSSESNVKEELVVTYTKDTGSLMDTRVFSGSLLGEEEIVRTIFVECNNISYKIHLVEATGKHYVD